MKRLGRLRDRASMAARWIVASIDRLQEESRLRRTRNSLTLAAVALLGYLGGKALTGGGLRPDRDEMAALQTIVALIVGLAIGRILARAGSGPCQ